MDERQAREFNRQLNAQFGERDKRIMALEKGLTNLSQYVSSVQQARAADDGVKTYRDHETHYANVILLLGYGGFFALWSTTAGKMSALWFGISGILIVVSLLLFIGFELVKTYASSISMTMSARKKLSPAITVERSNAAIDKVNLAWPFVFVPSVITGLAAGLIVLACFINSAYDGAYPPAKAATPATAPSPAPATSKAT